MSCIDKKNREKFSDHIMSVLSTIADGPEAMYIKGEYFGYFANRLIRKFAGTTDYMNPAFNSSFFNQSKQKTLANAADSLAALINRADPLSSAEELKYAITSVYWGFLGDCDLFAGETPYGLRSYLRGVLEKIRVSLESSNTGSQKDATMSFRRHLVIKGVLSDIEDETYRNHTSVYEYETMNKNGSIWENGKLVL